MHMLSILDTLSMGVTKTLSRIYINFEDIQHDFGGDIKLLCIMLEFGISYAQLFFLIAYAELF